MLINMLIPAGEEKEISVDPASERADIEVREGGTARISVGDNPRLTLGIFLTGRGASAVITGRFLGARDARQDITLRAVLSAPETHCRVDMRSALADTATSVFDGLIRVEEGAGDATGFLSYRALLLSPSARARPTPRLEVLTKHVASLGHAASVGKIDGDQIFYLRSRGLSPDEARTLIVGGFLAAAQGRDARFEEAMVL
jgi:Fe-S cluster assembly protein SufD